MRPLTLLLCAAAVLLPKPASSAAKSDRLAADDYLNLLRIDLRAAKARLVVEAMELSEEEAEVVLPLYRHYDEQLSKLNSARIGQLRRYTSQYASIDDRRARAHSRETFSFLRKRLDLIEQTTRRIERATSPRVAARFAQIENQMLMLIDVQLASELPLVPRRTPDAAAP